jgi:hypothetical protein
VYFTLNLVGKLKSHWTLTGSAATSTHATATAMLFPANAGLIFLTDGLTRVRYLVYIGGTLSIVPCYSKTTPSGPLFKGADGQSIPSWDSLKKNCPFSGQTLFFAVFASRCAGPILGIDSSEGSKSLLPQRPAKYFLLALQRLRLPLNPLCLVLTAQCRGRFHHQLAPLHRLLRHWIMSIR